MLRVKKRQIKKKKKKPLPVKGVRFVAEAKEHDGPRPLRSTFDVLVWNHFKWNAAPAAILDILEAVEQPAPLLSNLEALLADLVARTEEAGGKGAHILPAGGGSNAKTMEVHLPALRVLGRNLELARRLRRPSSR